MIKPHEYLDLDNNVLKISSQIIEILLRNETMKFNEIYNKVQFNNKKDIHYNFIPAINLLYLLGKLNYDKNTDTLELIQL